MTLDLHANVLAKLDEAEPAAGDEDLEGEEEVASGPLALAIELTDEGEQAAAAVQENG
jgi:hypothetical protein